MSSFYWIKTHAVIKRWFSNYVWDIPNNNKNVYLTFDDGPTPELTEWVLETLREHEIKATFFCIGNNIKQNPEIFKQVVAGGHTIGNHTFNHLNGWKFNNEEYFANAIASEQCIREYLPEFRENKLFRPPYGKIRASQARKLRSEGYRIIMWDVLSADFDKAITPEKCLKNVVHNTQEGTIIIFHDSVKAYANLKYALPRTIDLLKSKGFNFSAID